MVKNNLFLSPQHQASFIIILRPNSHHILLCYSCIFDASSFYILDKKNLMIYLNISSAPLSFTVAHATRLTNISCSSSLTSTTTSYIIMTEAHLVDDVEIEEVFQFLVSYTRKRERGSQMCLFKLFSRYFFLLLCLYA